MPRSIRAVIAPGPQSARMIVTEGPSRTLLTAHLAPSTTHPRALPFLLEALALWEGATVQGVLAVDEWDASCATTLYRDVFADGGTPPLYTLDCVPLARGRRRRPFVHDALHGADFRDLRSVVLDGRGR